MFGKTLVFYDSLFLNFVKFAFVKSELKLQINNKKLVMKVQFCRTYHLSHFDTINMNEYWIVVHSPWVLC